MTTKHIHPVSNTTMCVDGQERPMTDSEAMLYAAVCSVFLHMRSYKRAFYIMVVANLVLVWTIWMM